jgi:hypothetical protein
MRQNGARVLRHEAQLISIQARIKPCCDKQEPFYDGFILAYNKPMAGSLILGSA